MELYFFFVYTNILNENRTVEWVMLKKQNQKKPCVVIEQNKRALHAEVSDLQVLTAACNRMLRSHLPAGSNPASHLLKET